MKRLAVEAVFCFLGLTNAFVGERLFTLIRTIKGLAGRLVDFFLSTIPGTTSILHEYGSSHACGISTCGLPRVFVSESEATCRR